MSWFTRTPDPDVIAGLKLAVRKVTVERDEAVAALVQEQLGRQRDQRSVTRAVAGLKETHIQQADHLRWQLAEMTDNWREAAAELDGAQRVIEDLQRQAALAQRHLDVCPTAQAVSDHDGDKARENA